MSLANQKDTSLAYYFFDPAQKESLSPCTFLRSILHQILCPESLHAGLQRSLESIFMGPESGREPDFEELEALVIKLCNTLQKVIILVDGINETGPDNRKLVLHFLKAVHQSQTIIKLFVTSRPEVDVSNFSSYNQLTHINIRIHDTQLEIDEFINFRVQQEAQDGSLVVCDSAMIEKIKKALKMKAGGMYDTSLIDLAKSFQEVS